MKTIDEDLREHVEFNGLRNNVGPAGYELGDLESALNVDVDDAGFLRRRKGHSAVVVAGVDRDLFAEGAICLGVGSNNLVQIHPDWSTTTLHSGLTPNRALSYAPVGDRVYYTNGTELGVVQNGTRRTWGLEVPQLGTITTVGGALRVGRYQVALTYLRDDGQESGASRAAVAELTTIGGLQITLPVSSDATVSEKAVYISDTDGETLFLHALVPNTETTFAIRESRKGSVMLPTQFLVPPNILGAIDHIAYGNGRMLAAVGNRLYPSEPYAPELFDPRKGVPFSDALTMLAPLKDGTWIGTTSKLAWLLNAEPEKWEFEPKAPYGVLPGTAYLDTSEAIGDGKSKTPAWFFATTQGLCAGIAGGQLVNFTEAKFAYPIQERGASIVRRHRGMIQFVTTLRGAETTGNVVT